MDITLHQYLEKETACSSKLNALLQRIETACIFIAEKVQQGNLCGIIGSTKKSNIQGEIQQKLDIFSNEILIQECKKEYSLSAIASEEMDTFISIHEDGQYLLLFDPLDGSSNIDVNVSIGTIFSILHKNKQSGIVKEEDFLQPGHKQLASGYVIYGPQTILVLTVGYGVKMFTFNRTKKKFFLTGDCVQINQNTHEFAINMSNMRHWSEPIRKYIKDCLSGIDGALGKDYNMRWIASMVADIHRILCRGGVFMYPSDKRHASKFGKLRLLYEANPMSFLVEQAGGMAINGVSRILDITPISLHQRVSVILGSKNEIETIQSYCN